MTGRTTLLAFESTRERDQAYQQLLSMDLPNRIDYEEEAAGTLLIRMSLTQRWQRGLVSNFEYLMHLNTLAGRSYNDLTQYPIFPWILADYTSPRLDLTREETFRDLSKPMGAQGAERLAKFVEKYEQLVEMGDTPYFYGSHYSNCGSVLYYLVRLEPFATYFVEFQGGRFDVPDRAFHDLANTYQLASAVSPTDVKELIPEFFYLPEFLQNLNRFDLGLKQDGSRVDHVRLPRWALSSARLFIRRHREALESPYVSARLHLWIDLIFGCKQQGEAARKALNVFHPLTYENAVDPDKIEDELMRRATIAQIQSYGQTPRQLFRKPHPARHPLVLPPSVFSAPERLQPSPLERVTLEGPVTALAVVRDSPLALPPSRVLLQPDCRHYLSWGHWDLSLRVCSVDSGRVVSVVESNHHDEVLCAHMPPGARVLVTGGSAALVKVWGVSGTGAPGDRGRPGLWLRAQLHGHTGPVLCLALSPEWSVIASGSADGSVILWDLNRLCYIRSLPALRELKPGAPPVRCVSVAPSNGNVLVIDDSSTLRLWSINGEALARNSSSDQLLSCAMTSGTEGLARNVILTGARSGAVFVWDAWDLSLIRRLDYHRAPVSALAVSADNITLYSADEEGTLVFWRPAS